jgi:hypothetical protein
MSVEDRMTIDERRKYLRMMRHRYQPAGRKARSQLLDEMQAVTGLHRKALIRLMGGVLARKARTRQRGKTYGTEVDHALRIIDESLDYICAERLTPALVATAEHLARHAELDLTPDLLDDLARISVSTVRRHLTHLRRPERRLPRKGPQEANQARREVPMRRIPWDEAQPGHFEADLVHHCGPTGCGEYVHSVQLLDVATGWSERRAVLGRSSLVMADAFQAIEGRLPFPILELHPDNGSEFFNAHLKHYFQARAAAIQLSRSRPYCKNDNCHVEQKNASLVRAYLGDARLDTVEQTQVLNHLYDRMWLYYNFFQPVLRLNEKRALPSDRPVTRIQRRYDVAQTPFERLCATGILPEPQRGRLQALRDQTNPRQLRQEIYARLEQLLALPGAGRSVTQDVRETLTIPITLPKGEDASVTLSFDRPIPLR